MAQAGSARRRLPGLIALCVVPVLIHLAIVAIAHGRPGAALEASTLDLGGWARIGVVSVLALTHWAIYAGLLLAFALTLRPGQEPLVTAMTRRLHGTLGVDILRYTRRVTLAWSLFFALQLTLSVTLFLFAPLVVWSFFVNILDIPMVLAMFAAEYVCRQRCLRDPPRESLGAILAMIADIRTPPSQPASDPGDAVRSS